MIKYFACIAMACCSIASAMAEFPSPNDRETLGICEGIRSEGIVRPLQPIIVTMVKPDGSSGSFQCDAPGEGVLEKPVARTVTVDSDRGKAYKVGPNMWELLPHDFSKSRWDAPQ